MNDLLGILQNMGQNTASPLGMMGMPNIRFRDILQLLLLSVAVKIVSRAYEILNRLGYISMIPMQPQQPQMLLEFPQPLTTDRKEN